MEAQSQNTKQRKDTKQKTQKQKHKAADIACKRTEQAAFFQKRQGVGGVHDLLHSRRLTRTSTTFTGDFLSRFLDHLCWQLGSATIQRNDKSLTA